jgi:ribosomal-protein-alanine N-acetyltransferase
VTSIVCCPLTEVHLPGVLALDQVCFGGLWSEAGYRREMASPNSELRVLRLPQPAPAYQGETVGRPMTGGGDRQTDPALAANRPITDTTSRQSAGQTGDGIVGLGCYWAILDEAHITLLAIAPPYRGQGLGRRLLLHLLTSARQRGLARATLEVRATNQLALKLYQSLGFRTAGRRRKYYSDGEDALILWQSGLQSVAMGTTLAQWQQAQGDRLLAQGWRWVEGANRTGAVAAPPQLSDPDSRAVR